MNKTILLIPFLLFSLSLKAQLQRLNPADSAKAAGLKKQGDSLKSLMLLEQGLSKFREADAIYWANRDWVGYLGTQNSIAGTLTEMGKLDSAESLLKAAIALNKEKLGTINQELSISYGSIADIFWHQYQYDTSLALYEKALDILIASGTAKKPKIAGYHYNIGALYFEYRKREKALEHLGKSLTIRKEAYENNHHTIGQSHNALGNLYASFGDYDSALIHTKKGLEIKKALLKPNDIRLVSSLNSMGYLLERLGAYQEALGYHHQSIEVLNHYPDNHPYRTYITSNIGVIMERLHQYNKALEYYENALRLSKLDSNDQVGIADGYINIGNILLKQGKFQQALASTNQAKTVLMNSVGGKHSMTAMAIHNIGAIYSEMEEFEKAKEYFESSLTLRQTHLGKEDPSVSESLYSLGLLYYQYKDWDKALKYLKQTQELDQKTYGEIHPYIIETHNDMAKTYLAKERLDSANFHIGQALRLNIPDQQQPASDQYQAAISPNELLESYEILGKIQQKSSSKTQDTDQLLATLSTYQTVDAIVQESRSSFVRLDDKVDFMETAQRIYVESLATALNLYRMTGEQKYLSTAYAFVEKSRASVLLDENNLTAARQNADIPPALSQQEQALKSNASFYQSRINEYRNVNQEQADRYQSKLFECRQSLDSLELILERSFPKYRELKKSSRLVSLEGIQKNLDAGKAIIEFFQQDSIWHIFLVTQKQLQHKSFVADQTFTSQLQKWKGFFRGIEPGQTSLSDYKTTSLALYQKLFEATLDQLPDGITDLVLIPSEEIATYPLEAMIISAEGDSYKQLDYLVTKYVISYAFSASTLIQQRTAVNSVPNEKILAFAPEYTEASEEQFVTNLSQVFRDQLVPLIWNTSEAESVAQAVTGTALTGQQATEKQFKEKAHQYQILHLAMHALVDHEESMNSKLVFTPDQDSIEDGMLHTFEIFNLDLPAEMVVLSACNTGIGELKKGEGVISLARAFAHAGVPSLVMSHWNVNDQSTARLMTYFYQHLADGLSKSEALQQAKLDYLAQAHEVQTHPFFWGGFVLVGDTNPISNGSTYWWWLIILPIVGVFWQARRKRKRNRG